MAASNGITAFDLKFNGERLRELIFSKIPQTESTQVMLSHIPGNPSWLYGAGSLKKLHATTGMFNELNAEFNGTELEDVVEVVRQEAKAMGRGIGRVRLLTLLPKTCYSLHSDPDEYRFHVPLKTDQNSFFVSNDLIGRMADVGRLYLFSTTALHTAVNASIDQPRHHLVIDTCPE